MNNKVENSKRVDEIPLFGSRFLKRSGGSNMWMLTSGTALPVRLTKRESMFINAALHAAKAETQA